MVAFDPEQVCVVDDVLDPARAAALQATLGQTAQSAAGLPLPAFFHHIYFWDAQPPAQLGRDGHPRVGGIIPDMGLARRMWAGGRLQFVQPLRAGVAAQKRTRCEAATRKTGRSGPLGFVTLRHEYWQDGSLCLTEWQDLVYREEAGPDTPRSTPPAAPADHTHSEAVACNPTMLFRYSALTFNGHRIHYDLPYAREVEGYDGLVVHGPLLAQLLILMAQRQLGALSAFSFRATAPLMDFEAATLCMNGTDMWVRAPDGRQCMTAKATPTA
jgi:3-methylfumaryl-CoA hydratase